MLNPLADGKDPGQYSLSSFEKPKDVKRYAGVMSDMKVPYQIAVGRQIQDMVWYRELGKEPKEDFSCRLVVV